MMPEIESMTDRDLCAALRAEMTKFSEKDAAFAASLADSVTARGQVGASQKQRYWLEQMLDKARHGERPRKKTKVGEFKGLTELFDRARKHLKQPAIVIGCGGREIRLSVANARARVPGSIDVVSNTRSDTRTWFGRILSSGEFEASPRDRTPEGLVDGLARFAASPAEVAAEHGKLTGRCCFCNTPLTDERSTGVGYGRTCAKNYGLAWGARATTADLFEAAAA